MLQTFRKWFVLSLFTALILFGLVVTVTPLINPRVAETAKKHPPARDLPADSVNPAVLPASTKR